MGDMFFPPRLYERDLPSDLLSTQWLLFFEGYLKNSILFVT